MLGSERRSERGQSGAIVVRIAAEELCARTGDRRAGDGPGRKAPRRDVRESTGVRGGSFARECRSVDEHARAVCRDPRLDMNVRRCLRAVGGGKREESRQASVGVGLVVDPTRRPDQYPDLALASFNP
jgi:hypothetical protein